MAKIKESCRPTNIPIRMKFYRDRGAWKVKLQSVDKKTLGELSGARQEFSNEISISPSPSEAMAQKSNTSSAVIITEARLRRFMNLLRKLIDKKRAEMLFFFRIIEIQEIRTFFANAETSSPITEAEIDECVVKMEDDNKLMRSEDTIYVI